MELRHLEYFIAVAEEEHFTRAAERLHVAQSGLSASIRSLERELGAPLFVRSTRRVGLTEAGRALLAEARRTVASAAAARNAVAAVQGLLRGTVSIGTEQCLAVIDLPMVLARFRTVHPGVEIRLRQAGTTGLLEEVRTGGLDLAFVALSGARAPAGVSLTPLTSEPMMLVCHPGHPLAACETVDWSRLQDETFVDFHGDWGARQVTDRAFGAAGLERQVALEVNDVHSLLDFVAEDLGVALVPRPFAYKKNKKVHAVPLRPTAPSWVVSVAVPANGPANPATDALLSIVEESTSAPAAPSPNGAAAVG
ncbi:LysR family transcriptional regulator [Actinomadura sp. DC4]|uniref:LysR family transcriptional regulator n=1 Tax=Actinomadura sp. DC4 TaxID=3055069 RepID=UPI0025B10B34|nr:LysR family transcriptional regulator [Actinomadura sp. DC4]MDN3354681.1 LysR family transcriptional regulator [Actinomadura sp. DC4]